MDEEETWQHPIKSVGVIGVGGIGRPVSRRLAEQGRAIGLDKVAAFDANPASLAGLDATGVLAATSIADLVEKVDLVLLCLPGSGDVGRIARSHGGLLDSVRRGQVIVDHGPSSFDLTRQLATAFKGRGAAFLDAPVGERADLEQRIAAGGLAMAVGGDKPAVEAALPTLGCLAGDITHVGPVGSGQVVRHLRDLVTLQTFAALGEALMTAKAFGVDGDRLFDALAKGQGDDLGFDGHAHALVTDDAIVNQGTSIAEAGRRLDEAIQLANAKKLALTGAGGTLALLRKAIDDGMGERDVSGLFGTMETELKRAPREVAHASAADSASRR